jgi:hypothetical protein
MSTGGTKKMPEIIIDEEFKQLLPPLQEQEFDWLERDILEYGCMNPLVLWNNILIDGHNRYEIVTSHELPFNTISLEFESRDHVKIWIIETQIQRRNMTPKQLTYYRGVHYNLDKNIHGGDRQSKEYSRGHNEPLSGITAKKLSTQYDVSPSTIKRDGAVANIIDKIGNESPDVKRDLLTGKITISRKALRELASESDEQIAETAKKIESGTFERSKDNKSLANTGSTIAIDLNPNEAQSLEATFIKMSNELYSKLQLFSKSHTANEIKTALRSHIIKLEEFYNQVK